MSKAPNILFFFPDQHRYDWLGATEGLPVRTPNLDALAARGVRFTNAICPSPLCAPSRAALAAGLEYDRCRVADNGDDYPLDLPTFYQALRDRAPEPYHVMGCGKFDLAKALHDWEGEGKRLLPEWGFSDGVDNEGKWDGILSATGTTPKDWDIRDNVEFHPRGPYANYLNGKGLLLDHVRDYMRRRGNKFASFATPLPEEAYCDNWLAGVGLDLLRRAPEGKPWFIQINFTGPHDPWDITEGMERAVRGRGGFPEPVASEGESAAHGKVRENYTAMVENIDRWVGEFLSEVERRGELDNTLVVYSSDHGEMLGDHAAWGKSMPLQPSVAVPLIVAGPGVAQGRVVEAPTETIDLAATFLDWAGAPAIDGSDSRSLRPVLEGAADRVRDFAYSGLHKWRTVQQDDWKLIVRDGEEPELYDLGADPGETRDLAKDKPEVVSQLLTLIEGVRATG